MRKLDTPKRVTLPNGRVFYAKYKRVKLSELLPNIILRRKQPKKSLGWDAAKNLVNNLASRYGEWVVMVLVILI